jgi:hypothetical protein
MRIIRFAVLLAHILLDDDPLTPLTSEPLWRWIVWCWEDSK